MKKNLRTGWTMIEVVVASGVLMTTMSVVVSLSFRAASVERQSRYHRLAMDELSNQLDRITQMPFEQAKDVCREMELRSVVAESFPNGSIAGEVLEDSLGTRVELTFQWDKTAKMPPVTLTGWLNPIGADPEALP